MEKGKKILKNIKDAMKKVMNAVKFIISPIGQVVGWIILIVFAVILVITIFQVVGRAVSNWLGYANYYETYDKDITVIKELQNSGYQYQVDAPNFQNFKAFEYSVLMDAAEYLRHSDIPLMSVSYEYDQSTAGDGPYRKALEAAPNSGGVDIYDYGASKNPGDQLGGNTRVSGPFLVYEFLLNGFDGYASIPRESSGDSGDKIEEPQTNDEQANEGDSPYDIGTAVPSTTMLFEPAVNWMIFWPEPEA